MSLEFGRTIKLKSPEMISNHQIILLCLAGLCHDLGHCAFSHLYDSHIIPMFREAEAEAAEAEDQSVFFIEKHEEASYLILERIWERNDDIKSILSKDDIQTIGKMILGAPEKVPPRLRDQLKWSEYDRKHSFLYEVVSNDRTGIDVDKFDYLKRDSHYTGIPCTFDPQRLMHFLSLKQTKSGRFVVDYMRKSDELINSMWKSRDDLHRRCYQHRVVKCIDMMTTEMIMLCADAVIPGTNTRLRSAHHDLDSYLLLTDSKIISMVESVPDAKEILDRIRRRDLWDTIATVIHSRPLQFEFTETCIRYAKATFRDNYVHYIYYATDAKQEGAAVQPRDINTAFFVELIRGAEGGEIHLRSKWILS